MDINKSACVKLNACKSLVGDVDNNERDEKKILKIYIHRIVYHLNL